MLPREFLWLPRHVAAFGQTTLLLFRFCCLIFCCLYFLPWTELKERRRAPQLTSLCCGPSSITGMITKTLASMRLSYLQIAALETCSPGNLLPVLPAFRIWYGFLSFAAAIFFGRTQPAPCVCMLCTKKVRPPGRTAFSDKF